MGKPQCKFTLTEVTNRLTSFILLFHKFKTCNYLILEEHIILVIYYRYRICIVTAATFY